MGAKHKNKSKLSCLLYRLDFHNITVNKMWNYTVLPAVGAVMIGIACLGALILTDLIFVPGVSKLWHEKLWYSKEPILLLFGVLIPTIVAWFFAIYLKFQGKLVAKSWPIIAAASWLSLLLNPLIWLFSITTFFIYGFIVYFVLIVTGAILWWMVQLTDWTISQIQHK